MHLHVFSLTRTRPSIRRLAAQLHAPRRFTVARFALKAALNAVTRVQNELLGAA